MPKMISDDEREELEAMPLDASVYGESSIELPTDPDRIRQKAIADEQSRRERAANAEQARVRAERKVKLAKEHEQLEQAKREVRETIAQEQEAELEARLRKEHPLMPDAAWKSLWPTVRNDHYIAQRAATQEAERQLPMYSEIGDGY